MNQVSYWSAPKLVNDYFDKLTRKNSTILRNCKLVTHQDICQFKSIILDNLRNLNCQAKKVHFKNIPFFLYCKSRKIKVFYAEKIYKSNLNFIYKITELLKERNRVLKLSINSKVMDNSLKKEYSFFKNLPLNFSKVYSSKNFKLWQFPNFALEMPLVSGDYFGVEKDINKLSLQMKLKMFLAVVEDALLLHNNSRIIGDIKLENIFFSDQNGKWEMFLADLGGLWHWSSKNEHSHELPFTITPLCMAKTDYLYCKLICENGTIFDPQSVEFFKKLDVFLIGSALYSFLTNEYPFEITCIGDIELLDNEQEFLPHSIIDKLDVELKVLLQKSLALNPNSRPTMEEFATTFSKWCKSN